MTPPTPTFENYPGAAAGGSAESDPGLSPEADDTVATSTPPAAPPHDPLPRRLLLGLGAGIGGLAVIGFMASGNRSSNDPWPAGVPSYVDTEQEPPEHEESTGVGDLEVLVPDGWREVSLTGNRLIIEREGCRLTFLSYVAGADASAADEAAQQARRYAADVRKATGRRSTGDTNEPIESATVSYDGQLDGQSVRVTSAAAIDTDDEYRAAAVVSITRNRASGTVRRQVQRLREDFLTQFAGR